MNSINPFEHPICLSWPSRLNPLSAWTEHIPFAMLLTDLVRPRVFVELGAHTGVSYCAFCQAVKQLNLNTQCYAVDTWAGDEQTGSIGPEILENLRAHHDPLYGEFSRLIQGTFDGTLQYFPDHSIDLLHIDGLHTYEAVRHDFETWLPKLSSKGVVVFHDINVRERDFGVWRLWSELQNQYPHFEFSHAHGLGILQVGSEAASGLEPLFKMDETQTKFLREYFFVLGSRLSSAVSKDALVQSLTLQVESLSAQAKEKTQKFDAYADQVRSLEEKLTKEKQELASLKTRTEEREYDFSISSYKLKNEIADLSSHQKEREEILNSLNTRLLEVYASRSWRLIQKFQAIRIRFMPPGGRAEGVVRRLLGSIRKTLLKKPQPISAADQAVVRSESIKSLFPHLLDMEKIPPTAVTSPGRIGIHAHIFYHDLAPEFAEYFKNIPFPYDLFISVPDEAAKKACEKSFARLPRRQKLRVSVTPNRGRDIAPMFCEFGAELRNYDFIAHVHSKKSLYNQGATMGWREYLCFNLFGSERRIRQIFTLMTGTKSAGIVYPQNYAYVPYVANTWLANRAVGEAWCRRLGINPIPRGYFDFPAGSMYWARGDALRPLFDANIKIEDFPEEVGQTDGTLAHCLERLPVLASRSSGFQHVIIKEAGQQNWSPWRFNMYLSRTLDQTYERFTNPQVKVIAFDIFDTLLSRPFLDPEITKEIVVRRADRRMGELYLQYRVTAEANARQNAGRDIGLDEIYTEFSQLSGLSPDEANILRQYEEQVERYSTAPRADAVELLKLAHQMGKRVILISDMFLPKLFIEKMLAEHGIVDWDAFYLSSEIGLRKDRGDLYRYVFEEEGITPEEMLMVGDNERADVQIPGDMGVPFLHVLRPLELARGIPRLNPIVEKAEQSSDLNDHMTLGLLLRHHFSPVFYRDFDPASLYPPTPHGVGYSVAGPLVLGFVHWLMEKAQADNVDKLYFLAREGQILKMVYDRWVSAVEQGPQSDYLVISRRSLTVPAITSREDIMKIARVNYAPNEVHYFLFERYGIELENDRWDEVDAKTGWNSTRLIEVHNNQLTEEIIQLLDAVHGDIIAQAAEERPAMVEYLHSMGLESGKCAVVDVGYSATIQDRLISFLGSSIHGYYMMTDERATAVKNRRKVIIRGCYTEGVKRSQPPVIFLKSFNLEKLFSSDDAQVLSYQLEEGKGPVAIIRRIGSTERKASQVRNEIRRGILDYVDDVIALRQKIYPGYTPPLSFPAENYVAFVAALSSTEDEILKSVVLDDYYCGRGLIY